MTEFKFHSLGELCDVKGGKRLPKGEQLTKTKTNHPYIRTRDLHNNQVSVSDLEYVPDQVFPKISRYIVNEGDIILSIVGTIGLIASIPKELDRASLTENCVKLVSIDNAVLDKNFLYYYLTSELGQEEIFVRNVGSTQPKLPLYNIKDIPVPLPPLQEQKAIAEALSSLDDKIELLQKQNETLEALAQTLFRQWFIEEADNSWEEVELGELVDITSGYVHKSHELVEQGATPLLGMGVVGSSFLLKKDKAKFISSNNYKPTQIVDKASIILSTRDVTQEAEMLGLPVLAEDSFVGSIVGSNMYLLRSLTAPTLFIFHSLRTKIFRQYVKKNASGSTILMLRKGDLIKYRLRLPKKGYRQLDSIKLLHSKIEENANQSKTLVNLRDTLLPKLMSGQVRVKLD